ncbi:MAG: hypothetical protein H6581_28680 [Bacteroidia bacterium]|nr:hypothetical protein [Bacteroidia bacterium]
MIFSGCEKEIVVVENNNPPFYNEIPTSKIKNYINRTYIDLIGREPLPDEMNAHVAWLRANDLSFDSRDSIMRRLQFNREYVPGDSSYSIAYYHRMYELAKVRLLEGASNADIQQKIGIALNAAKIDSLFGDSLDAEIDKAVAAKLQSILKSEAEYYEGTIGIADVYNRMCHNSIYDLINMNTFNYINATFDDLFFRYPTQEEYYSAFDMIEYNLPAIIFGQSASNKWEYIQVLTSTREYYEGMIRWSYLTLLAREANTLEVAALIEDFYQDHDLQKVQRTIMISDEYAQF